MLNHFEHASFEDDITSNLQSVHIVLPLSTLNFYSAHDLAIQFGLQLQKPRSPMAQVDRILGKLSVPRRERDKAVPPVDFAHVTARALKWVHPTEMTHSEES